MQMSYEDNRRINLLRNQIAELKYTGDDRQNQDDRRRCYDEIRRIQDSYLTPEQLAHKKNLKLAREHKAFLKRSAISAKKDREEKALLKTITPKQEIINKIVDMNYGLRNFLKGSEYKRVNNKRLELMKEWDLKSTDIRRQRKFDKKYA